jgi:phosphatidate cytidylyltransferase
MNNLLQNMPLVTMVGIFVLLSLADIIIIFVKKKYPHRSYLNYIWVFFLILLTADFFSFYLASWGWGILSFLALREYFSLVDLRLQDRLGVLASYLSIPFMMHFVHTDWYNMFIITIPVYSFLVIPFLISISGRETEGAIYSIGTIDFGLFLFVYCIGHLAYISFHSTWIAAMLILNIAICDIASIFIDNRINTTWAKILSKYLIPTPITITLTFLLSNWTGIPLLHSIILGLMIPALVIIGNHTIIYFESDLGIVKDKLRPGRGLIIDNIKSILYTAPIVLHYIRYFIY